MRDKAEIQADIYRNILSGHDDIHNIVRGILAIPEIAIVDREAELPKNNNVPEEFNELACGAEDDIDNVARSYYLMAQQEMLKDGWIKEAKTE